MTLTIGRVTIVQNPSQLELNGDRLDVGGWFFGTDLNQAKVIREQLIGLDGNEDEPDVPVTWTYDSKVDGYYTIKSVAVSHIMGVAYEDFKFQYAMTLERIDGGFAAPMCEVSSPVVLRTNGVGVTGAVAFGRMGIPNASAFRYARYFDGRIDVFVSNLYDTDTGDVLVAQIAPAGGFISVGYTALPGDYYDGAALIEQSVGGVWYPVVGDQIGSVVGNLMRIGNGLIRVTFHTDGALTSEIFDGTVWESATGFGLYRDSTQILQATGAWKILRNDPAACTIVTSVQTLAFPGTYAEKVTINIERGKRYVELSVDNLFYQKIGTAFDTAMQLRAASVTAATALTGGIRQTSNNAQGHRWLMLSPSVVTNDLTNGRITIAAPGVPLVAQFGLGWELDGSAAVTEFSAANVATFYFAVTGPRQRVVSR